MFSTKYYLNVFFPGQPGRKFFFKFYIHFQVLCNTNYYEQNHFYPAFQEANILFCKDWGDFCQFGQISGKMFNFKVKSVFIWGYVSYI